MHCLIVKLLALTLFHVPRLYHTREHAKIQTSEEYCSLMSSSAVDVWSTDHVATKMTLPQIQS